MGSPDMVFAPRTGSRLIEHIVLLSPKGSLGESYTQWVSGKPSIRTPKRAYLGLGDCMYRPCVFIHKNPGEAYN